MLLLGDGSWVISPSDLNHFAACPWRLAHLADEKLGKIPPSPESTDPMMAMVTKLGIEHEERQLKSLTESFEVVQVNYSPVDPTNAEKWRENIEEAHKATLDALNNSTAAVFQATLFEETLPDAPLKIGFQGFADFLVPKQGRWEIWDAKLARRAKSNALTQLAAYGDHLRRLGVPLQPTVRLILGDGSQSIHPIDEISNDLVEKRRAVMKIIAERVAMEEPISWGDNLYPPCGSKGCPACQEQIGIQDDLFQIAGIRKRQRTKIIESGFTTLKDFSLASDRDLRINQGGSNHEKLWDLRQQAALQIRSRENPKERPAWEIISHEIIGSVPIPSPADIFLDFEGDPTYQEIGPMGNELEPATQNNNPIFFGIEYLIGLWGVGLEGENSEESYFPFWSEDLSQERQSFEKFLELLVRRTEKYPEMRVYHFAPYEKVRMRAMAARHELNPKKVEKLLDNYFVDLYPIVRKGFAIGTPSYGLKSLEQLYLGAEMRSGITGGDESVVAFGEYRAAIESGKDEEADSIRSAIISYNRVDCVSTNLLRDWIIESVTGD